MTARTEERHNDPEDTDLELSGRSGRFSQSLDVVGLLARLTLGVVLVVAGALKVTSPAASALAVRAFQLLPYDFAGYVGYALPIVEILVGILLITGLLTRVSALAGGLLMLAFIIGIGSAWARGLSIDCGCFGGGGTVGVTETGYGTDILRDVALAAAAVWLTVRPRTPFSLDRRLYS